MFENIRRDLKAHGGDWGAQGFWALVVYCFGRWHLNGLKERRCAL